jgi:hypothetical protein
VVDEGTGQYWLLVSHTPLHQPLLLLFTRDAHSVGWLRANQQVCWLCLPAVAAARLCLCFISCKELPG